MYKYQLVSCVPNIEGTNSFCVLVCSFVLVCSCGLPEVQSSALLVLHGSLSTSWRPTACSHLATCLAAPIAGGRQHVIGVGFVWKEGGGQSPDLHRTPENRRQERRGNSGLLLSLGAGSGGRGRGSLYIIVRTLVVYLSILGRPFPARGFICDNAQEKYFGTANHE